MGQSTTTRTLVGSGASCPCCITMPRKVTEVFVKVKNKAEHAGCAPLWSLKKIKIQYQLRKPTGTDLACRIARHSSMSGRPQERW